MHILHLLPTFDAGGAERMVLEIAAAQHARGHEVTVASAGGAWAARLSGATHITEPAFRALPAGLARATLALRRIIRKTRPDLIHAHVAGLGAIARAVSPRAHVIATVHGLDAHDYDRAARILRAARVHTVAVSQVVESELRRRGMRGSHLHHIFNGATLEPATEERIAAMAERLGVSRDRPLLVGIGRMVPAKDFPTLIRAAALLDGVDLVIAGDGPERPKLEALAKELGVDVRMPGVVDDVPALLQLATVMVATSTVEGASIAVLEAVSLGVACVVTPVCTHEELTERGAVVVVPSGAAVPFARALHPLLDDREKLLALRERSASIAHRFSVTRMVEEYETLGALLARS
jgi:glycosyltransferase involved in cell wall biosynthesis